MSEHDRETVPPDALCPHPKNADMYSEPALSDRFLEDIRENGVVTPVVVTENSHFTEGDDDRPVLISGHRRRGAAERTGHDVPIGERVSFDSASDELAAVLRYNDQREKVFSQRMGEADAIREVEQRAATERQGTRSDLVENCPEGRGEHGRSRDEIAERIGIGSGRTYQKARKVWDAAKGGHPVAERLVGQLDAGEESIHGAYTTLRAVGEFSTNDRMGGLLSTLGESGRLSEDDVDNLKAANPDSVVRYLSSEHGIVPVGSDDGEVPPWEFVETGANVIHLETAEVPTDSVRTDGLEAAFGRDSLRVNDERLGPVARVYKKTGIVPPFLAAPAADGEFLFLNVVRSTAFEACKLIGRDRVPVTVCNVDGRDREHVAAFAGFLSIIESSEFDEYVFEGDRERALEGLDPELQQLFRRLDETRSGGSTADALMRDA